MKKKTYKNLQNNIRTLKTPNIDVWKNQYSDKDYVIELENREFTCVCPKTGLPDFATITLRYSPDKTCIELKSLKMYMLSFRNMGIFHEHVINRILDDLVKACKPRYVYIKGEFGVRGGIKTVVESEYKGSGAC
ncbi:MAG: preQ(1) synthase [Candidatus Omnitrophota bacterium]